MAHDAKVTGHLLANEIERQAARINRSRTGLGINGRLVSDLGFYVLEYLPDILAALRAPQGDGAEAMRLLVQVSLIQARELKRLAPDDTIPADLVEAMDRLRAALDQHSLTKNQGGGDA